jgi:hypothetical protein
MPTTHGPADVELLLREVGSVPVVAVRGPADDPGAMVRLAGRLLELRIDGGHLVLDLGGLATTDAGPLCALFARLGERTGGVPIPAVVPDAGTRRLLRACGSGNAGLALFATVREACDVARPLSRPARPARPAPA